MTSAVAKHGATASIEPPETKMNPYPKIYPPFKRGSDNRLDEGQWFKPEFGVLADLNWTWTEKVDGTNIRIHWDGYQLTFGGRTDYAQIPTAYFTYLQQTFLEEHFEQVFQGGAATLYGEGIGAGIQKSGKYTETPLFLLFDIFIDRWWLEPPSIQDIADKLNVFTVPQLGQFSLWAAIYGVEDGLQSRYGGFMAEGVVGTAPVGLLTRGQERIQVKVKRKDFPGW